MRLAKGTLTLNGIYDICNHPFQGILSVKKKFEDSACT